MRTSIGILSGLLLAGGGFSYGAEDTLSLSYSWLDDGSCESALESLGLTYRHESADRSAYGNIRQAPSGGDCRQDSTSYTIDLEQRFGGGGPIDLLVKIGADERSVAAAYGIADEGGELYLRGDGAPAFGVVLPSGRAFTLTGIVGGSLTAGAVNIDLGYNVVGVDWSDGSNSQTAHLGLSTVFDAFGGSVDAALNYDHGDYGFGDARLAYSRQLANSDWSVRVSLDHAFGLTKLDAGVPGMQTFSGLPALLLPGSAVNSSTAFSIGFSVGL